MGLMPTPLAQEFALALAVGLRAMMALRTGLAGVPRVHGDPQHSGQPRLVHEEVPEWGEGPAAEPMACVAATGRNPLADPLEILKSNPAPGALGGLNQPLGND